MVIMRNRLKTVGMLTLFIVLCTQCLEKDDVLPNAIVYDGNQLRTDGYFYQIAYNGVKYNSHFFYRNGVLLVTGDLGETLEEMDKVIKKDYVNDLWYKKNKYLWGVFAVNGERITMNTLSQDYPHYGFVDEGKILNDTIFHITKFSSDGEIRERDEVYHFRAFSPKPDSTNVYIK
jgi:hypothetical protein